MTPTDPVKSVGVFAAYRNYQQATWRGVAAVTAHKTTNFDVVAGRDAIVVTSKPEPAGK